MQSGFRDAGKWYGYPDCCIEEFIQSTYDGSWMTRPRRKLDATGYVPCKECNKKSIDELVKEIQSRRICPYPFVATGMK